MRIKKYDFILKCLGMFWHKSGYCLLKLESQITYVVSRLEKYQNHQLSLISSYIGQNISTCSSFLMDFGFRTA